MATQQGGRRRRALAAASAAALALGLAAIAGLAAGCASRPAGAPSPPAADHLRVKTVEGLGLEVRVSVPEDPQAPTYFVEFDRGDGRKQWLDPQRRGDLVRVWLDDIGGDGTPDVLVHTVDADPNAYGHLDLFYLDNDRYRVRSFPPLEMSQMEGFRGRDIFAVREGRIYRIYPVYEPDDPDDEPSGGKREFVFDFATESWNPVEPPAGGSPGTEEG